MTPSYGRGRVRGGLCVASPAATPGEGRGATLATPGEGGVTPAQPGEGRGVTPATPGEGKGASPATPGEERFVGGCGFIPLQGE